MGIIAYPSFDEEPWPTLGNDVAAWIEEHLVHGPGDLFGEPVQLNEEDRAWLCRMYELEPPFVMLRRGRGMSRTHNPRSGQRRFERCVLSLRKGSAKTEKAAWIAAAELHADAPVRFAGWTTRRGVPFQPEGRGVIDPYIPMMGSTEEQVEELAYGALRRILEESPIAGDFDIGLNRILRKDGNGKAEAVAATPNARDGARTTFEHLDESHRITLDGQKRAWSVMLANLAKRPMADPWALETTTAPEPGAGSVAETTMDYVLKLMANPDHESHRIFFFHREASDSHDLATKAGLKAAIIEASGPYIAKWTDVSRIMRRFEDGDADRAYAERVWLNRRVQATAKAFHVERWQELSRLEYRPKNGAVITVGFDGSRYDDATGLVATEALTGYQWVAGLWERPAEQQVWEVPAEQVDGAVQDLFARYRVARMYCDPPKWESWISSWAGKYGDKKVVEWWTNRRKPMAYAIRSFIGAITAGELGHSGDQRLTRHIGNSCRLETNLVDEEEKPLWILRKERPDSPHKIDLAMAAILSWEARNDAIAAGEASQPEYSVSFLGGK